MSSPISILTGACLSAAVLGGAGCALPPTEPVTAPSADFGRGVVARGYVQHHVVDDGVLWGVAVSGVAMSDRVSKNREVRFQTDRGRALRWKRRNLATLTRKHLLRSRGGPAEPPTREVPPPGPCRPLDRLP